MVPGENPLSVREVSHWHWLFILLLKAWEDLRTASSSRQHWNRNHKHRTTLLGKEFGRCLVKGAAHSGVSQRVRPDCLRLHPEDPQSLAQSRANTSVSSWGQVFLQSVLAHHVPILAVVYLAYTVNEKYSLATIMKIHCSYHQNQAIIKWT